MISLPARFERPKRNVAVFSPRAGVLYADPVGSTGGAELQGYLIARALARRGLRVCHLVYEGHDLVCTSEDGVEVLQVPLPTEETPRLRYARSLWSALHRADAGVYINRSAMFETGLIAFFSRLRRRRFIFSASSLSELTGEALVFRDRPTLASYEFGVRTADAVVVQSQEQEREALRRYRRKTFHIPSFFEDQPRVMGEKQRRDAFLWVGGTIPYKAPIAYVELAERVPEATFWMVTGKRHEIYDDLQREMDAAAARLPNLHIMPRRPRAQLFGLYEQVVAVVNTSDYEGFPNAFLEGWSRGALALSLNIDPDDVIQTHGLGHFCAGSRDVLADAARTMWAARGENDPARERVVRYVRDRHAPELVGDRWQNVVERVTGGW